MLWIVGTGRSGTKSAAREYEGVHEPEPWIGHLASRYYLGERGVGARHLEKLLTRRARLDAGCVSDHWQSLCIPLIEEVDPEARFVWLVRDPFQTVRSFLRPNNWNPKNPQAQYRLACLRDPKTEHPVTLSAMWWRMVNVNLGMRLPMGRSEMRRTESLAYHENAHPEPGKTLTAEEAQEVAEICWETWRGLEDWQDTRASLVTADDLREAAKDALEHGQAARFPEK